MCGIAGVMMQPGSSPDPIALTALTKALAHRGPDGQGQHVDGPVGLVHTRLAIIDLETGDQPLFEKPAAPESGAVLITNGEIYNYRDLRREFSPDKFHTQSDCEPSLHLYRRDGNGFAHKLRGMYAIALYDRAINQLLLCRDPFGIKPLYYCEMPDGLAFASEAGALVAAGFAMPEVFEAARDEMLQLQFSTGRQTPFKGVQRVLPGETLVVQDGKIIERFQIAALPQGRPERITTKKALARLDDALMNTVEHHQRSDVPYGMFLSGGIDSSALLTLMARLNDAPVQTFTAGFPGTSAPDERDHARAVATACQAHVIEVPVTEQDFWNHLPAIAADMDDPVADYAIVPTWLLGRAAARDVKVVLTGEGGDELFGGYGRYRSARRSRLLGGRAMRRKGIFDGLNVLRDQSLHWRNGYAASLQAAMMPDRTKLQAAQAADCADWLPNDLLTKADRCLMAHGVEGRVPFLDPVITDAAFLLPDGLKIRHNRGKYLLRRWLDEALPVADAFAKKQGFTVPVGEWIAGQGKRLAPLVASQPGVEAAAHADQVRFLFENIKDKRQAFAAWTLLFYALWHNRHILKVPAHCDVFQALEATQNS
ncbi:MAG: asparagine synthase (glutamine-hydrolyzing) [Alphaproteobacteria bacterium]|jgi:asparagine synthase (glutamine-hydrolysing)|nr:asparagine synthase (glutamine-hydrolyzing) [Alphaproteobacteria bacterium]MBT4966645.1 asparagine synthase (glutamine-hydrolyzing) [Alphaproteobacteria bacterium]MBT5160654.1 asparagine synthase (glutamine-hydrolyzing) [Alphaproteobacteria bacterium]MBT5918282.1 asparagine synthase (glutamine-hydrolyzing) [Alphaproteobacteria bacterium]MBT6384285.1 asparagine synthase (glutamine-hydrolyzing) [Alphaproteobacteria bacterium]